MQAANDAADDWNNRECKIAKNYVLVREVIEVAMGKISEIELARNTRKILDRVVGLGEIIAIERNHTLIAQILPAERTMTAKQALANLRPMLTSRQGSQWLRDSKEYLGDTVYCSQPE